MGFRQGIGPLLLHWVLGGQNEERRIQFEIFGTGRDPLFRHGFKKSCLSLGRRTVDLIRKHDVGEDRPLDEFEASLTGLRIILQDFGTEYVAWHEIRSELNSAEPEMHAVRQGTDQKSLGQTGHAFQKGMAPGKQNNQKLFDHILLANDYLGEFLSHRLA